MSSSFDDVRCVMVLRNGERVYHYSVPEDLWETMLAVARYLKRTDASNEVHYQLVKRLAAHGPIPGAPNDR